MDCGEHDVFLIRLLGGELLHDSAVSGDENPVRQIENLRQVRRYHHHPHPAVCELANELVDIGDRADVDAAGRLIENDQLRPFHERSRDHNFLLVAAGHSDDARGRIQRLHLERFGPVLRQYLRLLEADRAVRLQAGAQVVGVDVVGDRHMFEEALELPVLGNVDDTGANGGARESISHPLLEQGDLPAMMKSATKNSAPSLRR